MCNHFIYVDVYVQFMLMKNGLSMKVKMLIIKDCNDINYCSNVKLNYMNVEKNMESL
jgi:hypothetical protein